MKITVKPKLEQLKIEAIGETVCRESVLQGSSLQEEAARLELTSHRWNRKEMMIIRYKVQLFICDMECFCL